MGQLLFLDAQTISEENRITSFGDSVEDLARDFQKWVKDNNITPDQLWYADIFEYVNKRKNAHVYTLILNEDTSCIIQTPEKIVKNAYRRRRKR